MKSFILSLFITVLSFAQVDSMGITWTDPVESDLDSIRIYADTTSTPTTWRVSIAENVETYRWRPPYAGLWRVRLTALDDSSNISSYSSIDTVTIWKTIDTIPSQFTFTDVDSVALSSWNQAYIVVAGCDSARFYPATGDSLKNGVLSSYGISAVWADVGDSIYTGLVASGTNNTSTHSIIYSSNGTPYDTFTVVTIPAVSSCDGGLIPDSASCFSTAGTGYWTSIGSATKSWSSDSLYMTVTSVGSDPWGVMSDDVLTQLTTYIVTFRAKSSNISARSINLGAGTVNSSTNPNLTTTFQNYTFDWTTASEQYTLSLRIDDQSGAGTQYVIDDIKIVAKP